MLFYLNLVLFHKRNFENFALPVLICVVICFYLFCHFKWKRFYLKFVPLFWKALFVIYASGRHAPGMRRNSEVFVQKIPISCKWPQILGTLEFFKWKMLNFLGGNKFLLIVQWIFLQKYRFFWRVKNTF